MNVGIHKAGEDDVEKALKGIAVKPAAYDDPLLIDQKHPRGLQDTVFHLVVGRDLGVPKVEYPGAWSVDVHSLREPPSPAFLIAAGVNRIKIDRPVPGIQQWTEPHQLQLAFGAVGVIKKQHTVAVRAASEQDGIPLKALHRKRRSRFPKKRLTIEVSEYPGVEKDLFPAHTDASGSEPSVSEMNRHAFVSHKGRVKVVLVGLEGDVLAQKRILGRINQKVAFTGLDINILWLKDLKIFIQPLVKLRQTG